MGIMKFDFKSQEDEIINSASSPSKVKSKNVRTILLRSSDHFFERFL